MKQRLLLSLLTSTLITMTFTACGEGNNNTTVAKHMTKERNEPALHVGKYARVIEQNDFDIHAIE
jgi:hypothetical protein